MTVAEIVLLLIKSSIVVIVFALGLSALPRDLLAVVRRPSRLFLALLSMFGIMLVVSLTMATVFALNHAVWVVLIALSLAPVPPILPKKQIKAGGDESYVVGLVTVSALFSVIWIPLALAGLSAFFGVALPAPMKALGAVTLMTVFAPLAAGALVHRFAPSVADAVRPWASRLGTLLLVAGALPLIVTTGPKILALVGDGTLMSLAAFTLIGLAAGHMLGGPNESDRTALALASGCRHPGIAIALGSMAAPNEPAIPAAVLLHLIVAAIVGIPYIRWRKHAGASVALQT